MRAGGAYMLHFNSSDLGGVAQDKPGTLNAGFMRRKFLEPTITLTVYGKVLSFFNTHPEFANQSAV